MKNACKFIFVSVLFSSLIAQGASSARCHIDTGKICPLPPEAGYVDSMDHLNTCWSLNFSNPPLEFTLGQAQLLVSKLHIESGFSYFGVPAEFHTHNFPEIKIETKEDQAVIYINSRSASDGNLFLNVTRIQPKDKTSFEAVLQQVLGSGGEGNVMYLKREDSDLCK